MSGKLITTTGGTVATLGSLCCIFEDSRYVKPIELYYCNCNVVWDRIVRETNSKYNNRVFVIYSPIDPSIYGECKLPSEPSLPWKYLFQYSI